MIQSPTAETDDDSSEQDQSTSGQVAGPVPTQPQQPAQPQSSAQPPQAAQPPIQVVAAHPKANLFHSVLNALGGGDKTQYSVDPQTGAMSVTRVTQTSGQLAKSILAGALTGMFAGAGEHGPGSEGRSAAAGFQAVQQQRAQQQVQQQNQANEDFERQQKEKLQQAQVFKANMQMYSLANQLGRLNKDQHDQTVAGYKDQLGEYAEQNAVVKGNASEKEAMDYTKYPPGKFIRVPDGAVPRTDENGRPVYLSPSGQITTEDSPQNTQLWDNTYSIVDRNARMPLKESVPVSTEGNVTTNQTGGAMKWVKQAQDWGPAVGGNVLFDPISKQPRQNIPNDMPAAAAVTMQHQVAGLDALAHEMENYGKVINPAAETNKVFGSADNPMTAKEYLKSEIQRNPKLLDSIEQWRRTASTGSTEPDIQILQHMDADPKAKAAKGDLIGLFGGGSALEQYKEAREARASATKTAAETQARVDVEDQSGKGQQQQRIANLTEQEKQLQIDKLKRDANDVDLGKIQTSSTAEGLHFDTTSPDYPINQEFMDKLNESDPGMAATVKALGEGREILTPQAARTKDGKALLSLVNRTYPRYNAIKVEDYLKTRQSPKIKDQLNILSTAMEHLGTYYDNLGAVSGTPYVGGVARAFGSESAKNVQMSENAASDEFAKLYKGGAATEKEKEDWENSLGGSSYKEKQNGAKGAAKLLDGKIRAFVTELRNATPPGLKDDTLQIVSPEAAQAYKRITGKDISSIGQPMTKGPFPTNQPAAPQGRPVIVNGKTVGYTTDGKTMTPAQ